MSRISSARVSDPQLTVSDVGDTLTIGRPARFGSGSIRIRELDLRQAEWLAAISFARNANSCELGDGRPLVGIDISATYRVEHPFAIGRDLRIADITYGCKILEGHWALRAPLRSYIDSEERRRRQQ